MDLYCRIWAWLPARADKRRATGASVIAAAMGITLQDALDALKHMESSHHAVRDARTGTRAEQWHRGIPYTAPQPEQPPALWEDPC